RRRGSDQWNETPMEDLTNDRWRASFVAEEMGSYEYVVRGWVDQFATWWRGMQRKVEAGVDTAVDRLIGAELIESAAKRASGEDTERLLAQAELLRTPGVTPHVTPGVTTGVTTGRTEDFPALVSAYADTSLAGPS